MSGGVKRMGSPKHLRDHEKEKKKRRKVLNLIGTLTAPSHVFYLPGKSKMFFWEIKVDETIQDSEGLEVAPGAILQIAFPVEALSPELKVLQKNPKLGSRYEFRGLNKASLSLSEFGDTFTCYKISGNGHSSVREIEDEKDESFLNSTQGLLEKDSFSYTGIVTNDSHACSGVYVLDKAIKLIVTSLCVVSNLRVFKKGETLEIYNGHYRSQDSIIFLCARSFVKLREDRSSSILHFNKDYEIYSLNPIVDLALDYNLGLTNVLQSLDFIKSIKSSLTTIGIEDKNLFRKLLKTSLGIQEFSRDYRSLIREFFLREDEHERICVLKYDAFLHPLLKPYESLRKFLDEIKNVFHESKNIPNSKHSIPYITATFKFQPKFKRPLIGVLSFNRSKGRYTLSDNSGSFFLILLDGGKTNFKGFNDINLGTPVVLHSSPFYVTYERTLTWEEGYFAVYYEDFKKSQVLMNIASLPCIDENIMNNKWIVLRSGPPAINNRFKPLLEYMVEGLCCKLRNIDIIRIPVKDYSVILPGSTLYHKESVRDINFERGILHFSHPEKSLVYDPRITTETSFTSHKASEGVGAPQGTKFNLKCLVFSRLAKEKGRDSESSVGNEFSPYGFVRLSVIQEGDDNFYTVYLNKSAVYPLGIVPGMILTFTSLEHITTPKSSFFTSTLMTTVIYHDFRRESEVLTTVRCLNAGAHNKIYRINAFLDGLNKLIISACCGSCKNLLTVEGKCSYSGCHSPDDVKKCLKVYCVIRLSDETGCVTSVVVNRAEQLKIFLKLDDSDIEDIINICIILGEVWYTLEGPQKNPQHNLSQYADEAYVKRIQNYLNYFFVLSEFHRFRYLVRCGNFKEKSNIFYCLDAVPAHYDEKECFTNNNFFVSDFSAK